MRGSCYDIYNGRLRVEADDGPALRSLQRLLAGFPEAEEAHGATGDRGECGGERAPDAAEAQLSLRFAPRPVAPPEGAVPLFRQTGVWVHGEGSRLWFTDGWSRVCVDALAGWAAGEVHPGSWTAAREFEAVLRLGLLELLRGQGRFPLRAATLVAGEVGILAAGDTGSGKSTLTYGWARRGGAFRGDDTVLLRVGAGGVTAGAWPEPPRLDPALAAHFPELAGLAPVTEAGRPRVCPSLLPPGAPRECRPTVLLLPVVTPGATRVEPLAARAALAELLPASALLLAHRALAPAHLEALRGLVAQCRCYRLYQGPDLLRRPSAVGDLLRALARPQDGMAPRL